jgi:hypothetical protein
VSNKPHPVETALSEMAAAGKPCPRCGTHPGVVPVHGIPGSLTYWCAECAAPPQWTTTPPTEPGWYWWRCCSAAEHRIEPQRIPEDAAFGEWWPVRIEEPPR